MDSSKPLDIAVVICDVDKVCEIHGAIKKLKIIDIIKNYT